MNFDLICSFFVVVVVEMVNFYKITEGSGLPTFFNKKSMSPKL